MALFDINPNLEIKKDILLNSVIYHADNFYKNPDEVVEFIKSHQIPLWKSDDKKLGKVSTFNGLYFEDKRLVVDHPNLNRIYDLLSQTCGQYPQNYGKLITNNTRFIHPQFNNYENSVWYPHLDSGYTAIVYLNHGSCGGTNLYVPQTIYPMDELPEHLNPWKPRLLWPILKVLTSKYNRMVFFDGQKYAHGMSINDDRFFTEDRINQVFFFQGNIENNHPFYYHPNYDY